MKVKRGKKVEFTSVSIPTTLFRKIEHHIDGTGFPSVSGYVAYVLRTLLSETGGSEKANYEAEAVKKRLKALGYT